ncbi:non-homologous end-joining DNA ligase [Streptomyces hoynatensis]|uniref:DNA ligase (ATP) n=1 Tax=Streptomyces hoynatensis TaxID=1141874 RepID=A0A3A9Z745_9ACTN|nr:non-homologous end-joining DNA ligase [Streptomyces hoynatensis]RKN43869.1 DNA ligase [Streptomyces hoynatensis]
MARVPEAVAPILAVEGEPPHGAWGYEYKWDGYRCCLRVSDSGEARLTSRNGNDFTPIYPELTAAPEALRGSRALLDGEIVAPDAAGRPDFGLLQRRHQRRPTPRLLAEVPVTFLAFDLLLLGGEWLLGEPYARRRERLAGLGLGEGGEERLAAPPYYTEGEVAPERLVEIAGEHGLEGVVAKRLDSPYLPGRRSRLWVKKPLFRTQEAVVGGWRPGEGRRREAIGSLLLGAHDERGGLRYIGHVGTGFTEAALAALAGRLRPLARQASPFAGSVPRERARGARWVEPLLVGEVAYRTWTRDGRLRHPVWRGLREDRDPSGVRLPGA